MKNLLLFVVVQVFTEEALRFLREKGREKRNLRLLLCLFSPIQSISLCLSLLILLQSAQDISAASEIPHSSLSHVISLISSNLLQALFNSHFNDINRVSHSASRLTQLCHGFQFSLGCQHNQGSLFPHSALCALNDRGALRSDRDQEAG